MNVSRVHFHRFNFCAIFEVIVRRVHLPSPTRRQRLPDCTQESVVNFFRLAQRSVLSTPRRLSHSTLRRWDLAWSGRVSSSLTLARMPALPVMTLFCPSLPLTARPGTHSHTHVWQPDVCRTRLCSIRPCPWLASNVLAPLAPVFAITFYANQLAASFVAPALRL